MEGVYGLNHIFLNYFLRSEIIFIIGLQEKEQEAMAKAREERDARQKKLAMEKAKKNMMKKMPSQKIIETKMVQGGQVNI